MRLVQGALLGVGALALLAFARDSSGTGAQDGRLRLVVTQTPAGVGDGPWSEGASLSDRYPSGTRVALVETGADGERVVRLLSNGLDAAGAPSLSPRGDRVVFAGRRRPDSNWSIYEARLQRGQPVLRVELQGDCGDPAYLPKEDIVFVVKEDGDPSFLCVTTKEDGEVRRITFGPGASTHPSMLQDGRILFTMTTARPSEGPGAPEVGLFTVNPDGTMLDPFSGVHDGPGVEVRARQTDDGRVVFLAGPAGGAPLTLSRVKFARPMGGRDDIVPMVSEPARPDLLLPLVVGSVEPLLESGLVVTGRVVSTSGARTFGAYSLAPDDERAGLLYDDPEWDEVEAVPVARRATARARPSSVQAGKRTGTLVCYDAAYSDGVYGPASGAPAPATITVQTRDQAAMAAGLTAEQVVGEEAGIVELGRVVLASDRSVFLEVPADVPLRVRTHAADDEPIATSGWFWIRPGETRACFGCHERRDTAPPNRIIRAISQTPQKLLATKPPASE